MFVIGYIYIYIYIYIYMYLFTFVFIVNVLECRDKWQRSFLLFFVPFCDMCVNWTVQTNNPLSLVQCVNGEFCFFHKVVGSVESPTLEGLLYQYTVYLYTYDVFIYTTSYIVDVQYTAIPVYPQMKIFSMITAIILIFLVSKSYLPRLVILIPDAYCHFEWLHATTRTSNLLRSPAV